LVRHPTDRSRLVVHRLPAGLEDNYALRHLVHAFQPARDKVALVAHPWDLSNLVSADGEIAVPSLSPDSQAAELWDVQRAEEPYLIIGDRANIRSDLLRELGELEVLDGVVRVARDPYNLSLFPVRYYNPYVEDAPRPFLERRYINPFVYGMNAYYFDYPYVPYKGLYYYPVIQGDQYTEDDVYSHPAVKPVAIIPGDEYATYYPTTYPILSTLPIVPAPPPPSVAPIAPIVSVSPIA
jgi:hypothetical protein